MITETSRCDYERLAGSFLESAFPGGCDMMFGRALREIGYFDAPASKGHHLAERGGLLQHSVNVTRRLVDLAAAWHVDWPRVESPYIVGMLHDLVKCRCYRPVPKKEKEREKKAAKKKAAPKECQGFFFDLLETPAASADAESSPEQGSGVAE